MAATLPTVSRNAACDAVVDLIDRGDTAGAGYIDFLESGGTIAAHLHFNGPAFGAAATGVATMDNDPAVTNGSTAVGGSVSTASIYSVGGTAVMTGITCAAAAATTTQILMSTTTVGAGDTVTLSSMTITMPAS